MINLIKILAFIFMVTFSFAQVNDGTELLEELQNKYKSIDDFTSTFKQVSQSGQVASGKFYYKAEDNFRIELKSRVILSDGETVWNYIAKNNKVIITPAEDESNSFSIEDYVFNYPEQCEVTSSETDEGKSVLILKPNTSELDFKEVRLIIAGDFLIDEIIFTDLTDKSYRVYWADTKINQNLSKNLFTFEIPQGTQIIDLR